MIIERVEKSTGQIHKMMKRDDLYERESVQLTRTLPASAMSALPTGKSKTTNTASNGLFPGDKAVFYAWLAMVTTSIMANYDISAIRTPICETS